MNVSKRNIEDAHEEIISFGSKLLKACDGNLYNCSQKQIRNMGGNNLLRDFFNSTPALLALYIDPSLCRWKFPILTKAVWDWNNDHNVRTFMKDFVETYLDNDLCKITVEKLTKNHGTGLYKRFDQNLWKLVKFLDPSINPGRIKSNWDPEKINDWAKFYVTENKDWYNISVETVTKCHGIGLMRRFDSSPISLAMYCDPTLVPWKFETRRFFQKDCWYMDDTNLRKYGNWFVNDILNGNWYAITSELLIDNYGSGMLQHRFNGSPLQFALWMDPLLEECVWKFNRLPDGHWKVPANRKKFLYWFVKNCLDNDIYKITRRNLHENHGAGIYQGSILDLAIEYDPNVQRWRFHNFDDFADDTIVHDFGKYLLNDLKIPIKEISKAAIFEHGGGPLLVKKFRNSPFRFLSFIVPN